MKKLLSLVMGKNRQACDLMKVLLSLLLPLFFIPCVGCTSSWELLKMVDGRAVPVRLPPNSTMTEDEAIRIIRQATMDRAVANKWAAADPAPGIYFLHRDSLADRTGWVEMRQDSSPRGVVSEGWGTVVRKGTLLKVNYRDISEVSKFIVNNITWMSLTMKNRDAWVFHYSKRLGEAFEFMRLHDP